jgi:cell division septal protein FtsQ
MNSFQRALATILGSVILTMSLLAGAYRFLSIQTIECQANHQVCPTEIQQKIAVLQGRSLFFTDVEAEVGLLLADQSYSVVSLEKQLPSTIKLELAGANLQYQVSLGQDQWVVYNSSAESNIVSSPTNVPTITIDPTTHPELATSYNQQIVDLINALDASKISYNEILQPDIQYVEVTLEHGYKAYITLDQAMLKVAQLRIILDSLENELTDQNISTIDLRFTHPVLK